MTQRHPEIIYLRRRVAAILLLLVVVALCVWLMVSLGGKKEEPAPAPAPNAFTTSTASTTAPATPSPTATASASATPTPTPTAQAKTSCALEDLVITASADKPNYGPEERPKFYLTVKNPTQADCKIDLRKDGLRFEVYDLASNKPIWADTDCNPSEDTSERTFPAGQERHYEAVWSRTTSAPGECNNRQPVAAGSYFLHTLVGKNNSEAFTFNLG
ncbi:hypothetical protein CKALI_01885 [Corynebacterium kalinowskii]|uniref:Uncharacterized protein n=1 Tax=Corynebacterium kalinowskii TaxID=2675216 RepID=A0A6B8VR84_9CORY|nr:hypothetical protein [Corynebacterium kalinowskii]QGU01276.1 hypothetical protein CKALI_01885 [Corynebacterium kalinowskii]